MIKPDTRKYLEAMYNEHVQKYVEVNFEFFMQKWDEPHRYHHNTEHLREMCEFSSFIEDTHDAGVFVLAAFYHDIVWNPMRLDEYNIDSSVCMFNETASRFTSSIDKDAVRELIRATPDTKGTSLYARTTTKDIKSLFVYAHYSYLDNPFHELVCYEALIRKEYSKYPYKEYAQKRSEFLGTVSEVFSDTPLLAQYVEAYSPTIGLYVGSFDPYHIGHHDIVQKANAIFDKVVVAKLVNPDKNRDTNDHVYLNNFECINDKFKTVLEAIEYLEDRDNAKVTLIRGMRPGKDVEEEYNYLQMLRTFKPDLKHIVLFTDPKLQHVSSSAIRGLRKIDPKLAKSFLEV